ncbi:MAG: hypothetical protein ABWX73_09065 [Marmoricola sp.]
MPVRRRLAALAVVLLVPALGACNYQTDQVYQPAVGVNNRDGTVDVLAAVVVSSTDGKGTFVASLVNSDLEEADTLTGVAAADEDGPEVQLAAPIEILPEGLVNLADSGAVSVTGETVAPGAFIRLVLTFESGQETEVNVPVVDKAEEFDDIEPATPSPSAATPSDAP